MTPIVANLLLDLSLWSCVVFGLLCLVIGKLGGRPLAEALGNRETAIVRSLHESDRARDEMARIRREQEEKRARSRDEARQAIEEARRDARQTREEIIQRARIEADRIAQRAEREVQLARQKALHELYQFASELSTRIAERIVRTHLTAADHHRLIGEAIEHIGRRVEEAA